MGRKYIIQSPLISVVDRADHADDPPGVPAAERRVARRRRRRHRQHRRLPVLPVRRRLPVGAAGVIQVVLVRGTADVGHPAKVGHTCYLKL